ncbi:MAG: hypothetical protein ACYC9Y_05565 [Candidatus Methylomirabilia bacterium]
MNQTVKTLAVVLVGAGLVAFAAAPAVSSDEFCAMGGTLIKAEVVKEKALEWGKDRRKATIAGENEDSWSVLTLGKSDDNIAILVGPDTVFFGVAGKGGNELDARELEKAFGKDLRSLSEAVRKEMTELWKAGAVKIQGADVQKLADAVALGTLEKDRDWELTTQDCKGMDLDTSDLK